MHDDKIAKRELLIRVLVLVFAPLPVACVQTITKL